MFKHPVARKVLVLGASSALGKEVCERYLAPGHFVIAHYYEDPSALSDVGSHEGHLEHVQCNFAELETVPSLAKAHTDADIMIFLAALAAPSPLENIDVAHLERTLAIGTLSNYILMGTIGSVMAQRQWGRIVIGSSIGVKFGGARTPSHTRSPIMQASSFAQRS